MQRKYKVLYGYGEVRQSLLLVRRGNTRSSTIIKSYDKVPFSYGKVRGEVRQGLILLWRGNTRYGEVRHDIVIDRYNNVRYCYGEARQGLLLLWKGKTKSSTTMGEVRQGPLLLWRGKTISPNVIERLNNVLYYYREVRQCPLLL